MQREQLITVQEVESLRNYNQDCFFSKLACSNNLFTEGLIPTIDKIRTKQDGKV